MTDKETSVLEALRRDLEQTSRSFTCSGCGCNVIHPSNSNFLLVFGTGTSLLTFYSVTYPMSVWRAVKATWAACKRDASHLSGHVDLGEADLSRSEENSVIDDVTETTERMTEETAMDLLENCADLYNVEHGPGEFEQYCPDCASERDQ